MRQGASSIKARIFLEGIKKILITLCGLLTRPMFYVEKKDYKSLRYSQKMIEINPNFDAAYLNLG